HQQCASSKPNIAARFLCPQHSKHPVRKPGTRPLFTILIRGWVRLQIHAQLNDSYQQETYSHRDQNMMHSIPKIKILSIGNHWPEHSRYCAGSTGDKSSPDSHNPCGPIVSFRIRYRLQLHTTLRRTELGTLLLSSVIQVSLRNFAGVSFANQNPVLLFLY